MLYNFAFSPSALRKSTGYEERLFVFAYANARFQDTRSERHIQQTCIAIHLRKDQLDCFLSCLKRKMLLGTVQITGETLGNSEVESICDSLRDNSIRLLSLRECNVRDDDYKKLVEGVKENDSLVQLNLNLGICNGKQRIRWLAEALSGNKSLNALL